MSLNLNRLVFEILKQRPGDKLTAKEMSRWIFENFREDCEEKRRNSKQNLSADSALVQQISAEIAAQRPAIQRAYPFIKTTETRPIRYYYWTARTVSEAERQIGSDVKISNDISPPRLSESNLYPMLAMYLRSQHNVFAKRIDEKKSSNSRGPNGNKWLFPDLAGMEDLGGEWAPAIQKCVREYGDKRARLWSFEVKILLNRSNVREAWFQTVSNSSWANFGYLAASQIDTDVIRELRMLSAVHRWSNSPRYRKPRRK